MIFNIVLRVNECGTLKRRVQFCPQEMMVLAQFEVESLVQIHKYCDALKDWHHSEIINIVANYNDGYLGKE